MNKEITTTVKKLVIIGLLVCLVVYFIGYMRGYNYAENITQKSAYLTGYDDALNGKMPDENFGRRY